MRKKTSTSKAGLCGRASWRRFLVVGLCSCVSLTMYANVLKSQVSLSFNNTTLKDALEQLQEQAGVSIIYSNNVLNDEAVVNLNSKKISLEDALHILLLNQNCSYKVENGQVILYPVEKVQPAVTVVAQEGFKVKGSVSDVTGPLAGVNIMVKGTMTGVISDMDGNFEITAPYSGASLIFSYIGY